MMVCRSVEEGRRRVQAQLEETQGRLGESQSARHSLETAKLDMELKVRGMGIETFVLGDFWSPPLSFLPFFLQQA